ncbi:MULTISPECIES: beta-galactosidase [Marinimicrobium]|uniref:beta-galactosidase n=1 Tax=Marinimicrobium TaxID=359337 RepID=UPI00041F4C1D|nr:beta-galactosidase [Marinimicrobium agarilyticum]
MRLLTINKSISILICSLALAACDSDTKERESDPKPQAQLLEVLYDFEEGVKSSVKPSSANLSLQPGPEEGNVLSVEFKATESSYSGVTFKPEAPWDWSQYESFNLRMDMKSIGEHSTQIYLNVEDADGNVFTRSVNVPVGDFKTYYAKMSGHDIEGTYDGDDTELNFSSGLRSNPPTWDSEDEMFVWMWGTQQLNTAKITKISLSVQGALFDKKVLIDDIRLESNPPMKKDFLVGIVDRFGQNAKVDYPGKVQSEDELIQRRKEETASLKEGMMADRSKFGGWKNGPQLEATGYFRTEKYNGKWSLVDPEGYLYFATGLDIIRLSNTTTMTGYDYDQDLIKKRDKDELTPEDSIGMISVSDEAKASRFVASETRANMFKWLPGFDHELANHYSYRRDAHSGPLDHGETFSFYQANLERKYGEETPSSFLKDWERVTIARMLNWGFTSLGNWTDPQFYDNETIPYFANGWIIGDFKTVSSGNDFWGPLPDVFDPKFTERANATAAKVAREVQGSPWAVGVFIDNEMSFGRPESDQLRYGIVINTLGRDAKSVPTKREFTRAMRERYESIEALNAAWDIDLASWEAFAEGFDPKAITPAQREDYSSMLELYASEYYRIVDQALEKHMPNHLYLGSRLPDWGMPIEVVRSAAKYVDVVSYNAYKEGLTKIKWDFLKDIDMPSIIGEWHIGATDRGLFHPGLIHASSQQDRARMYKDYMKSLIDNPYFVGGHWFQYMDSPITGRAYDGENYNVGFVDVTDTPYPEMVEAAKEIGESLYQRRFDAK